MSHAAIAAISCMMPTMFMISVRLYTRTESAISAAIRTDYVFEFEEGNTVGVFLYGSLPKSEPRRYRQQLQNTSPETITSDPARERCSSGRSPGGSSARMQFRKGKIMEPDNGSSAAFCSTAHRKGDDLPESHPQRW